ncbi:MAG: hypothetical protein JW751_27840 [Polyangiaceae bacterium]|nr:hypothetical protein [Polyangiaceae bacterium]
MNIHPIPATLLSAMALLLAPSALGQVPAADETPAADPQNSPAAPGPAAELPAIATPNEATTASAGPAAPSVLAEPRDPLPAPDPPPASPPDAAPKGLKRLAVGARGFFEPSVLLQGWAMLTSKGVADGPDTTLTFRIRRAELKVKGELIPERIGYSLMIDPAKTLKFGEETLEIENQDPAPSDPEAPEQVTVHTPPKDTSILQDLFVTLTTKAADVSFGQYRTPLGLESTTSSSKLWFPERALATRTYADKRDIGLKVEKKFKYLGYSLGVFNGQGQNTTDKNRQKDLVARLDVFPFEGGVLGVAGYTGIGERRVTDTKDRLEGHLRAEAGAALLQAEYFHAWTEQSDDTTLEGHGAYGMAGYHFGEKVVPVVRVGFVDTDVHASDTITRHYEVGLNYLALENQLKFQAAYTLLHSDLETIPHDGPLKDVVSDGPFHEVTLAAQLSF